MQRKHTAFTKIIALEKANKIGINSSPNITEEQKLREAWNHKPGGCRELQWSIPICQLIPLAASGLTLQGSSSYITCLGSCLFVCLFFLSCTTTSIFKAVASFLTYIFLLLRPYKQCCSRDPQTTIFPYLTGLDHAGKICSHTCTESL